MKRQNRLLRDTDFTKIWEQAMDWINEYLWAPFVLAVGAVWRMLHRHDKELAACADAHKSLTNSVKEATDGRNKIYNKIETVRKELGEQHADLRKDLTEQHETLRREQREDFQEIRKTIASIGK
jgi:hypothetical protein